jgi:hypothetical protein
LDGIIHSIAGVSPGIGRCSFGSQQGFGEALQLEELFSPERGDDSFRGPKRRISARVISYQNALLNQQIFTVCSSSDWRGLLYVK